MYMYIQINMCEWINKRLSLINYLYRFKKVISDQLQRVTNNANWTLLYEQQSSLHISEEIIFQILKKKPLIVMSF